MTIFMTVAIAIGMGIGFTALLIHPRVDQLISGDWLPEPPPEA